ncbi:MAG TPA: oxygen-dependent coproporphyrinogen oxidase [Chitinophagaceae bacterium]
METLNKPPAVRSEWVNFISGLQNRICNALERMDGKAVFSEDRWEREEGHGGGGQSRVIQHGNVFEKGGVNISVVHGEVTTPMRQQLAIDGEYWFAAGLSLVIHPLNPFIPTVHCNYRMFELSGADGALTDRWFGGGTDLTPYYLFADDVRHFHRTYKGVCDRFDPSLYPLFKANCDDYFVNTHRNHERRGVGGIFYDHCRPSYDRDLDFWMNFGKACGDAFAEAYLPIVEKRKDQPYDQGNQFWQEIRRGRYVEFNLIHDRGTLFGLKTGGRTESILMSLPPRARFEYDYCPAAGTPEDELLQACLAPREWV